MGTVETQRHVSSEDTDAQSDPEVPVIRQGQAAGRGGHRATFPECPHVPMSPASGDMLFLSTCSSTPFTSFPLARPSGPSSAVTASRKPALIALSRGS